MTDYLSKMTVTEDTTGPQNLHKLARALWVREADLVSEFALYYAASPEGRGLTVYCEHGDQFDPISRVEDYSSPLRTSLGCHVLPAHGGRGPGNPVPGGPARPVAGYDRCYCLRPGVRLLRLQRKRLGAGFLPASNRGGT